MTAREAPANAPDVVNIVLYPTWWTQFGLCYECKDGLHGQCIGVPCDCECQKGTT